MTPLMILGIVVVVILVLGVFVLLYLLDGWAGILEAIFELFSGL